METRKRVRPASPGSSLLERVKRYQLPRKALSIPTSKTQPDTQSITSESDIIMPRRSPRLELLRALRQSDFANNAAAERANLDQLIAITLLCKLTRRTANPGNVNSIGTTVFKKQPQHLRVLFTTFLLQYISETNEYNRRMSFVMTLLTERYIEARMPLPKSFAWLTEILPRCPDHIFEHHTRMTRRSFGQLVHVLETRTPQFFKRSSRGRRQLPISTQLHVALFPLGVYGNRASFENARVKFGYGVGTIHQCLRRVVNATVSMTSEYIKWPTAAERAELCRQVKEMYGFESAFFCVDDSTHNFAFAPSYQRSSWFDRKSRYSMQAPVTNDIDLRVRHLVVGWPGSTHDARVLGSADYMAAHNEVCFFTGSEHGLGDAAFGLHKRVVPNYKEPLASFAENHEYNRIHSSFRVKSEHTIGHVKNRFQGAKEVRMRLASKKDVFEIVKYITAVYVLHNMLIDFKDPPWPASQRRMDTEGNTAVVDQNPDDGVEPFNPSPTAVEFREKMKEQVLRFAGHW